MSQAELVLQHLKNGFEITSINALNIFGIISLPKRICELKDRGYKIKSTKRVVQKRDGSITRVSVYTLPKNDSTKTKVTS